MLKVLALGPNPALQRVLSFDGPVVTGGVNRATSVEQYCGGKGQGVALALNLWSPGSSVVGHFLGGDTGLFVESEIASAGIEQVIQHTKAVTRTCTTLLDGEHSTELIDPSGTVSEEELHAFLAKLESKMADVGGVALCGTTPPGADELYGALAEQMVARSPSEMPPILLLDGFKGVDRVLRSGRVDVLKLNVDEVKALTGQDSAAAAAAVLLHGDEPLLRRPDALLALTDGPRTAFLFSKSGDAWTLEVPPIECVNSIGAGDVCTGIFLHSLVAARRAAAAGTESEASLDLDVDLAADAFGWGLAAACARCTHQLPTFSRAEVEQFRERIAVEQIREGSAAPS